MLCLEAKHMNVHDIKFNKIGIRTAGSILIGAASIISSEKGNRESTSETQYFSKKGKKGQSRDSYSANFT